MGQDTGVLAWWQPELAALSTLRIGLPRISDLMRLEHMRGQGRHEFRKALSAYGDVLEHMGLGQLGIATNNRVENAPVVLV